MLVLILFLFNFGGSQKFSGFFRTTYEAKLGCGREAECQRKAIAARPVRQGGRERKAIVALKNPPTQFVR
jgi:hypothetical protein